MYQTNWGRKKQISFPTVASYYEFIGYLAKNDGSSKIVVENNDDQGAWGKEGRIEFNDDIPQQLMVKLKHTAGNAGIKSRVNCNDFVDNLITHHRFAANGDQDLNLIRKTIPLNFLSDFDRGYFL